MGGPHFDFRLHYCLASEWKIGLYLLLYLFVYYKIMIEKHIKCPRLWLKVRLKAKRNKYQDHEILQKASIYVHMSKKFNPSCTSGLWRFTLMSSTFPLHGFACWCGREMELWTESPVLMCSAVCWNEQNSTYFPALWNVSDKCSVSESAWPCY